MIKDTQITQSVSELTDQIKKLLEDTFFAVKVEGEISNCKPASSGHIYFTLKDNNAQIPAVIWRGVAQRYRSLLDNGLKVVASGQVQLYAPHGRYQLIIDHVQPAGQGDLQLAFERLKLKLQDEGLFDPSYKKQIPRISGKIGVVTAATSAAFQDIRQTIETRFPLTEIVLYPSAVQGQAAAAQIVEGIKYLDARDDVDVILIGRGGGSLEDLWPFNEEIVARAIFACQKPIVSAVGHEIDFTISDFVADFRATTPTQGAVTLTPDQNEVRLYLDDKLEGLKKPLERKISRWTDRMQYFQSKIDTKHLLRLMTHRAEWLSMQQKWLTKILLGKYDKSAQKLEQLRARLQSKNPNTPLKDGYVRVYQDGKWVRKLDSFEAKKPTTLHWEDGDIKL
jgi:exodeoxyribonuclease VII large subunit